MARISKKWKRILWRIFWAWMVFNVIVIGITHYAMNIVPKNFYKQAQQAEAYDAIIVPGVPFYRAEGKWSFIMKARVYWAYHLYEIGKAKNIIYSGGAVYSPYVEAEIMGLYGEKLGVNADNIFTESRAEHSTENLYYSLLIAQEQGFNRVALATDPFQTRMLQKFAQKHNIKLDYIPIVFTMLDDMPQPDPDIDPSLAYTTNKNFVALPDRETWDERMEGTRGERIIEDKRIPLIEE